jgi:ribosomal protein S18 acetylase RimI-like enzyme
MSNTATRLCTERDLAPVAALFDAYRQFYGKAPDLPLAMDFIRERMQSRESVVFVAERQGHGIVGFSQMYPTFCSVAAARIGILYDLFVDPGSRKLGVGRALMRATESYAADSGLVRLELSTARTNLPAQSLYESLGWVRDEAFHVYSKALQG